MKKVKFESAPIQTKLDRILLSYRTTPHSFTKETPARFFFGREFQTRLSLLKPELGVFISKRQASEVDSPSRSVSVGDEVMVLDFRGSTGKWAQGTITKVLSPVTYIVQVENQMWKRHIDQIRAKPRTSHTELFNNNYRSSDEILGSEPTTDRDELTKSKPSENTPEKTFSEKIKSPVQTIPENKASEKFMSPGEMISESNQNKEPSSLPVVVSAPENKPEPLILRRSTRNRKPRVLFDASN
ncbi:hypothetical protein HOLleu_23858 [Holothuria leucospilota]|uniref:Uncharacterized protein n=1 Tax=Holothuria leucospilota TaxID=206669 RepID=A0A9Q1H5H6_HOLLE|nr:hypothetical protein HOLleu_23858 [Holothuria leucospilota]